MQNKNRHPFAENDGLNTHNHFIKSVTVLPIHLTDLIDCLWLAITALRFSGRA